MLVRSALQVLSGWSALQVLSGAVTYVQVVRRGSGYTSAPTVSFSGGGVGPAAFATTTVSGGAVTSVTVILGMMFEAPGRVTGVTITDGGSGYTSAPSVVFGDDSSGTVDFFRDGIGAGATATVSGGAVTSVTVTDGGRGYTSAPSVRFLR